EGQGRATLHALVDPREAGPLKEALKPDRKPILAQMAGATVVATLIAVPLIVLQSGIFGYYHRDDYLLRDIHARAQRDRIRLTAADAGEVERIFKATMEDKNPTSDRLVLLMNALQVYGRPGQLTVTELLAGRGGPDRPPHQSLADSQLQAERYAEAEATYEQLKQHKNAAQGLDADRQRRMDLAGARVAEARGDLPLAIEQYRGLYIRWPEYVPDEASAVPLRREFATVLLQAGAFNAAQRVLEQSPVDDLEAQRMRVAAHLLKGRAIAAAPGDPNAHRQDDEAREYGGAERVVEALLRFADRKSDPVLKDAAERMRSDVHMARQSWTMARQIVDKVATVHGNSDPDLIRRLAQVQLGLGDYAGARHGFATLLENDRVSGALKGDVIRGFLEAAADPIFAPGERERAIALGKVLQGGLVHIENDPVCLARLGWVLHRLGRPDETRQVLERARQRQPNNPEVGNQVARILILTGNEDEAAALLAGSNPFRARQVRVGGLIRRGDWGAAAAELRKTANEFSAGSKNPDGTVVTGDDVKRTELLLGTVLGLQGLKQRDAGPDAFAPAIVHYEGLQQRDPDDPDVAVALGNVHLWSAERVEDLARRRDHYATALRHFQHVLAARPWAPDVDGPGSRAKAERGFIDAAAGGPGLDDAQTAIAKEIVARRMNGQRPDLVMAARLAQVLIKTQNAEARRQGVKLIRKAAGGPLTDDERRELANALSGAGEAKLAADILGGA
ncbi:MAG TPA: tetratricopeptide repeat protein, partial [Gemmataceae bacterium]|nr:tetratricopeptide repeat protein [Gemmataceae bacterium]